jgi:FkbH-like protein
MSTRPLGVISIAATFTADPILLSLGFMLEQAGIPLDVQIAPYHQIFQELLSDSGILVKANQGINILLIRLEDFIRDEKNEATASEIIERTARELGGALAAFSSRAKIPTIVSILPATPRAGQFELNIARAADKLSERVRSLPGLILLSDAEIARYCADDWFDPVSDELAHIPYSRDYFAAIGLAVARKAHAALTPAHKVLVLDCDNTLWHGIVGEDGVDGIKITEGCRLLQKFAIKAHAEGTLICLASKNNESEVLEVFNKRSDMLLKLDHVVAHRINWDPKPQSILSLAKQLNLGLDSFVFLDDNPVECSLMRAELPQVVTLQIPGDERVNCFVSNLWPFDKLAVTEEDQRRTQLYKEDAARQASEAAATDLKDFIASLNVKMELHEPGERDWPRLAQLTQRTNQFNFTTKRRTEPELRTLAKAGTIIRCIKVSDRFGDYGLVGLVIANLQADRISLDTFLLSCRVLGRGVEHTILRELGDLAHTHALPLIAVDFVATPKNEPARAFIDSVARQFRHSNGTYLVPTKDAAQISHRPGSDPDAVIEASRQSERKSPTNSIAAGRSERYQKLAERWVSGRHVAEAAVESLARTRSLPGEPSPATSDTERRLLKLWQEVLGISGIGIDDDYASLGGSSLAAAHLFAEIVRQFDVKLPLTTIMASPTVRALARDITEKGSAVASVLELKAGSRRKLFLVHDGDGETLLYANVARRLPAELAVFAINPDSKLDIPLAHTRIEAMAQSYIQGVREKQPSGPYLLGGMCAGGLIAYEMAGQLLAQGEQVELVLILDGATPQAQRKLYLATQHRSARISQLFSNYLKSEISAARKLTRFFLDIARKAWNLVSWEATSRMTRWTVALRFQLLHSLLMREAPWPKILPTLTFRQIYQCAEAAYEPKVLAEAEVILVRATVGAGGDTPYVDLYVDDTLGWGRVVPQLRIADVDGGHFSMLQEPFAEGLALTIKGILPGSASTPIRKTAEV